MTENQQEVTNLPPEREAVASAEAEKLVPQSTVNGLINKGFHQGYTKAKAELAQQQQQVPQQMQQQMPQQQAQVAQQASMGGVNQTDLHKLVAEHAAAEFTKHRDAYIKEQQQAMQNAEAQRQLTQLKGKVDDAQKRYPDFDEVTSQVDFSHPDVQRVLHYANTVDNAGDVLYDLAKNPSKIATLLALPPQLATQEVRKLSGSIVQNQQALASPKPNEPLSQTRPSNVGVDTGAPKTVADYKKIYRV